MIKYIAQWLLALMLYAVFVAIATKTALLLDPLPFEVFHHSKIIYYFAGFMMLGFLTLALEESKLIELSKKQKAIAELMVTLPTIVMFAMELNYTHNLITALIYIAFGWGIQISIRRLKILREKDD